MGWRAARWPPALSRRSDRCLLGIMDYMNSHVHHTLLKDEPNDSKANCAMCIQCRALLPISYFGLAKISKSGKANACKPCIQQYQRLKRTRKYGSVSKIDDSLLRNVLHHNTNLIKAALSNEVCTLIGFVPHTDKVYKVVFGPSAQLGMDAICLFSADGNMLRELAYSGQTQQIVDELISFIKQHEIRLELSEVHMMTSKNVIYYI